MLQKLSCISFLFKSPCAKLITRKFYLEFYLENFKVIILFRDNIWGYQSLYLQLMSKYNKKICFLLCIIDYTPKLVGLFLWIIKKLKQLLKYIKNWDKTKAYGKKIWADKGSEFYKDAECRTEIWQFIKI